MTGPVLRRVRCSPDRYTYRIPAVGALLARYVGDGAGWADPFAGLSTLAEYRNDMDPTTPQPSHVDAYEWVRTLPDGLAGALLDPPYSREQISRHYRAVAHKVTALDTSNRFLARVQDVLAAKTRSGGLAISLGWTGLGLGRGRRFEEVEVLLLVHGPGHYATHAVVERKADHVLEDYPDEAGPASRRRPRHCCARASRRGVLGVARGRIVVLWGRPRARPNGACVAGPVAVATSGAGSRATPK
ncbi:hypothetical protein B1B_04359 [mine drainage metagenome]|uniref:Adenine-specific DNA methylase n=2 Tax=mine drainage metagenome TaxID=410659 RepID=T1CST1_9ZZZZ